MKRFQMDRPVMVKRWRMEWEKHGRDFGNCHCGAGMGTMRKNRPFDSCSPGQHCTACIIEAEEKRLKKRRDRYAARLALLNNDEHP